MTQLPLQPYFMNVFGHYKTIVKTNPTYTYAGMRDWLYQEYGAILDVGRESNDLIIFESERDALLFVLRWS